jgi:cyclase
MLTRRVIACLDIRGGRVVKGVGFENLRDVGDPLLCAQRYAADGADELCFLDVTASIEERALLYDLVRELSRTMFIPLTVGGGVRGTTDARSLLRAGADKVALNTAAVADPALISALAREFGSQCVVLSIDARQERDSWVVTTHGGRRSLPRTCIDWAREGADRGAGEILLNVIDTDGARNGFGLDITAALADAVTVPVIASGGAGHPDHFAELFLRTRASAALAASIFHDGSWTPATLKAHLRGRGINVRP